MGEQVRDEVSAAPQRLPQWQSARRERIVAAALAALDELDYEQIQIRDVAQAAGVALGTLYRYFSSKEHLYSAVLLSWAEPAGRSLDDGSAEFDAVERIRVRIRRVVRAFERQPRLYKMQVSLHSAVDPQAKELLTEFARYSRSWLIADFAALGPARAADTAAMLWAVIAAMLTDAIIHRGRTMADVYRVADSFIDLVEPHLRELLRADQVLRDQQ
ncbi:TetR/AcrR family transcriptional regulator [Nocardia sp. alder85J]|uniref:TetR/AcrR family transcriptional regulator n=1 Tax=Nocardia sp. alder85J TaxID=2862949 RepID=UPI001CD6C494|nr:TetR/AcrR family transcriptional regulator [Nocardia sp. alder85J]MCX4091592.1 TetR/AcrR family transcriptional regulator [Nocardia sp. alder85J]